MYSLKGYDRDSQKLMRQSDSMIPVRNWNPPIESSPISSSDPQRKTGFLMNSFEALFSRLFVITIVSLLFFGCGDASSPDESGKSSSSPQAEQRSSEENESFSGVIKKHTVVTLAYILTNPQGKVLDKADKENPFVYIHGVKAIVTGLEEALTGKKAGDELTVSLEPEKAYGLRDEQLIRTVPRSTLENEDSELEVGMQVKVPSTVGPKILTITAIDEDMVTLDANHPLAGVPLKFQVEVISVRKATEEEIRHRHVHGQGGVKH